VSVLQAVGDLVRLGLSGVRVAGCWRFGADGFEWCPCCMAEASACNMDTTQTQPHQISNTQGNENKTTDVVIQEHIRKLQMMDKLMSETC